MEHKWLGGNLFAWIALGITLIGSAITYGTTVATTHGQIATLKYMVEHNREELVGRVKSLETSLSTVYGTLATLNSTIKIDVEVIKEQIRAINGSIQRMEYARQKAPN